MQETSDKPACQCELAGYCKRHGAIKTQRQVGLCQSDPVLFAAWEDMAISQGLMMVEGKDSLDRTGSVELC